ncbi:MULTISPECIES: hypothetical protein [unclassified Streptomyces]|uniref:hypothetical protein n=1 Tax=unclassified Streptomyces TaxID=2593676 RepID=UPI0006FB86E6|nr:MULTISPECIES: hypothetical protein [unclassified Streptomyces]KQX57326.1 hypothetical protein ASD33_26860 [Streptomyces sp. Root1304]KRA98698.1 hypothetical protein ASE09_23670 [Streptomyces sp. Root66D1]
MSLSHIVLASGRRIRLTQLRMSSTYAGMLEGYPCKRVNDRKVEWLQRDAERAYSSLPVHVVPPVRAYPDERAGAFGPVEVLPSVFCVGVFDSAPLDPAMDGSSLVVAWFQPAPEVPTGEDADPALRGVAWEELAEDYEL